MPKEKKILINPDYSKKGWLIKELKKQGLNKWIEKNSSKELKQKKILLEAKKVENWLVKNQKSMDSKGIPICPVCSKPMQQAYDNIAKRITGYEWKCKCTPKIRMSLG